LFIRIAAKFLSFTIPVRCISNRNPDQPQSIQAEKHDQRNNELASRNPVKETPYRTGNDHEVYRDVDGKDFSFAHGRK
jgi:hypothetical protein